MSRIVVMNHVTLDGSRTLRLTLRLPRAAGRRARVHMAAGAVSARPVSARRCVRVARAVLLRA